MTPEARDELASLTEQLDGLIHQRAEHDQRAAQATRRAEDTRRRHDAVALRILELMRRRGTDVLYVGGRVLIRDGIDLRVETPAVLEPTTAKSGDLFAPTELQT